MKKRFAVFFILGCITTSLLGAPANRIARAIDPASTVQLAAPLRPEAIPANDRGPVDPMRVIDGVTLFMPPTPAQQAALDAFLEAQRDPSSPDYLHWLTPEEFADRFGASQNDIAQVAAWLRGRGLTVEQTARGRNFIMVSGSAARLSGAFQIAIHHFEAGGTLHFANNKAPSIPQALSGVVTEIRGLDDFRPAPPHVRLATASADYTSGGSHYLAPGDLATIYNINGLYSSGIDGTGQKVVIVGQTDLPLADIQNFRSTFGLPAITPQVVLTGTDPGTSSGDAVEAVLDVEWSGAAARNASIIYVNSRNVFTSAQYAIDQKLAPVISMSYGGCEQQNSSSIRSLAQQANAQGITWIASAGDSGAAGCDYSASVASQGLAVNIPASIPEVTAIGGTTFSEGGGSYWSGTNGANGSSATSYIPETSWNDTALANQLVATGGGASIFYSKPSWQSGTGVPNDGARDVPDISFSASADHDGYVIYQNGSLRVVGGTSAPAPMFAGVLGLLNQYLLKTGKLSTAGLGNINPTLYHLAQTTPSIFHDITSGNNIVPCTVGTKNCTTGSLGYSAGAGYDQVTGLGSADVNALITGWTGVVASTGTTTSLTANPATVAPTGTVQLIATVHPASGTATPTGLVGFSAGSKALGTATLSGAIGVLNVPASSLASGANTITATYVGNSSFTGSAGSTVVTVTSGATGSKVVPGVNPNPVVQQNGSWTFTITLTETAGQATTLTNFTVNGTSYAGQIVQFFGTSKIPAKGSISSNLRIGGITPPANLVFGFTGVDPSGTQWTRTITVPFN